MIDKEIVEKARAAAKAKGWKFKYANRKGKQYITVIKESLEKNCWDAREDRTFVLSYFPAAVHTSGSYQGSWGGQFNHTYRINPAS